MVLMAGRVGVRERQRGRPQPRVVLKGSVWKRKRYEKKEKKKIKDTSETV